MPGETGVLPENKFPVIADTASWRQRLFRFRPKIWAVACRYAKVPDLIWPETETSSESRMIEIGLCDVPRFRTRRERRVFHFGRVIKSAKAARDRNSAGVTRSPNHW